MIYEKPIFKYLDLNGTTATLRDGTLLFSSPLFFNDPFDISIQTLFGYDAFDLDAHLDEFVALALSSESLPESNQSDTSKMFSVIRAALAKAPESYRASIRQQLRAADIWDVERLRADGEETLQKIKVSFECGYVEKHRGAVLEFVPAVTPGFKPEGS